MYVVKSKMFLGVTCVGDFTPGITAAPGIHWYPVCLALRNSSATITVAYTLPVMQDGQPNLQIYTC